MILQSIRERAAADPQHIILPEGEDIRTIQAAEMCSRDKIAKITIIGDEEKIRELYLWVYAREPDAAEMSLAKRHLAGKAVNPDAKAAVQLNQRQVCEDIVWALLNTKEFLFHH